MKLKYIITKIIAAVEVLAVFFILILFYLTREVNTKKIIYIPKGNTNYTIKYLQNRGEDIAIFDKPIIRFFGYPQAGWINLKATHLTKGDFLYRLTHNKAALAKIMIIPGETNYFIYKQISKKLKIKNFYCDIDEGFLAPNTYYLPIGMQKKRVCKYLYIKSLLFHKRLAKRFFGIFNYKNYKKYLVIASIIQKEAGNIREMRLISAVIYNRLKKHMKLQMDGTLNYGRYSHTKITAQTIRKDYSFYNTYKHYGLPKKAVCVPSREAIVAAIFPTKVDYLYFVRCGKRHIFSRNYKKHLQNIKKCRYIK